MDQYLIEMRITKIGRDIYIFNNFLKITIKPMN